MLKNKFISILNSQIFVVFVFALFLRFLYVYLDYPFVLHPDEPTVINSTINLRYDPNPMHFDWPTLYYYFTFPFFYIYEKVYFLLIDFQLLESKPIESINYYLLSRFITSFFGAGTVISVYLILRNLKISSNLSIIGACVMAVLPFHVTRSAQALTDAPMVLFASISIYFLTKILDSFSERNFLISCFFAGLSVSTKYNGYMIFISIALFLILFKGVSIKDTLLYFKSLLVSLLGFFIGTPYFVFDYETFFSYEYGRGALWQFENVGKVSFPEQFYQFINNLFLTNYSLMGYIPLISSTIFIILFFIMKDFLRKDSISKFQFLLIIQFIYIFWSVSGVETQRSHYLFLVYLFLPIFTVFLLNRYLTFKYSVGFVYLLVLIFSTYSLFIRSNDVSVISLYYNLEVVGDKNNLLVSYNNNDIEKVLEKLKIPKVKFNPNSASFSSKVTHVFSTEDICYKKKVCGFELQNKIESRADSEIVYVFKRK